MVKILSWIRTILAFIIVFLFFTVWSFVTQPIIWLLGLFNEKLKEKLGRPISMWALRFISRFCGARPHIIGQENIQNEPVLYVSNHKSFFDMILSYPLVKSSLGYISKKEFSKLFTFKIWMEWCGCIFVDRSNPREGLKSINMAVEKIKKGTSIWICPEGTRVKTEGTGEFHEASFKIADKTGCKIVPVTFVHTNKCFEAQQPLVLNAKPYIIFGKPYECAGLDREQLKEVHAKVVAEIKQTYDEYYPKPYK